MLLKIKDITPECAQTWLSQRQLVYWQCESVAYILAGLLAKKPLHKWDSSGVHDPRNYGETVLGCRVKQMSKSWLHEEMSGDYKHHPLWYLNFCTYIKRLFKYCLNQSSGQNDMGLAGKYTDAFNNYHVYTEEMDQLTDHKMFYLLLTFCLAVAVTATRIY